MWIDFYNRLINLDQSFDIVVVYIGNHCRVRIAGGKTYDGEIYVESPILTEEEAKKIYVTLKRLLNVQENIS